MKKNINNKKLNLLKDLTLFLLANNRSPLSYIAVLDKTISLNEVYQFVFVKNNTPLGKKVINEFLENSVIKKCIECNQEYLEFCDGCICDRCLEKINNRLSAELGKKISKRLVEDCGGEYEAEKWIWNNLIKIEKL